MRSVKKFFQDNLSLSAKLTIKQCIAALKSSRAQPQQSPLSETTRNPHPENRPAILVCDERIPSPDRDAGSLRMLMILKALTQWSDVLFLPFNRPQGIRYEQALWDIGVETGDIVEYRRLLKTKTFSVAILSRPTVAEALLNRIRRVSSTTRIVFDQVDTHFKRLEREHQTTGRKEVLKAAQQYRKLESSLAQQSDLVWCASPEDKRVMQDVAPDTLIEVVPTIHDVHDRGLPFEERRDLLFVGSMAHTPNADAVHYFVKEIYPRIHQHSPDIRVNIIGSDPDNEIGIYNSDQISVLGYVPEIEGLLHQARVFVAPLRFGAGIKGKIGEAMSYGLPVVTTPVGAEGFGLTHGRDAMIATDPEVFADAVIEVYGSKKLWEQLADNAWSRIQNNFTPEVIAKTINDSIRKIARLVSLIN